MTENLSHAQVLVKLKIQRRAMARHAKAAHALRMAKERSKKPAPPRYKPKFILALRAWREHFDMTQELVAERVGLSPPAISLLERGLQGYSCEKLEKLAALFDTTPGKLFDPPGNDNAPDKINPDLFVGMFMNIIGTIYGFNAVEKSHDAIEENAKYLSAFNHAETIRPGAKRAERFNLLLRSSQQVLTEIGAFHRTPRDLDAENSALEALLPAVLHLASKPPRYPQLADSETGDSA